MTKPFFTTLALAAFATVAACSDAKLSADHSAAAVVYGSAAAGESVATTVAVPLAVSGGALVVSGAGIAEVGSGSLQAGSEILEAQDTPPMTIAPNGAPKL